MARYIKTFKDAKQRKNYQIKIYRFKQLKLYFGVKLQQQKNKLKSYCQVTGASRSYYKQFAFSRHCLRKNVAFGLVPGVMKSSW